MKQIKILLLITVMVLLLSSCKKDENGYRIAYYKNKKVEGHCFYFCDMAKDSIWPAKNTLVTMESSFSSGMWGAYHKEHFAKTYTDEFGRYSFDYIVKTIDGKKVSGYFFYTIGSVPQLSLDDVRTQNHIQLDTSFIWVYIP